MEIIRFWDLADMINNAPSSLLEKLSCQSHKKAIWSIRQDFTIEMLV